MLKTKIVAFLGLTLTLSSLLLGSRTLGYQRAVFSLQLGGLFLVLGGFFRLFDNHGIRDVLAGLYDLEASTSWKFLDSRLRPCRT